MKAIGILVFTQQDVLDHKVNFTDGYCYWVMKRLPKRMMDTLLDEPEKEYRLYMAVKGIVQGYFTISDFYDRAPLEGELIFYHDGWHPIENGEVLKPHQGFQYYLHDEGSE